jgi:hypothetical protein
MKKEAAIKETTWARRARLEQEREYMHKAVCALNVYLDEENTLLWDCLEGLACELSFTYFKSNLCYGHRTVLGEAPDKRIACTGVRFHD